MQAGLIVMAVSGVLLVTLLGLFRAEDTRGHRVGLTRGRELFDVAVETAVGFLGIIARYIGVHVIRMTVHYVIHAVLGALIAVLHKIQIRLSHLQLRNHYIVKAVNKSRRIESHLEQLSQHKEEVALSDAERKRMKQH